MTYNLEYQKHLFRGHDLFSPVTLQCTRTSSKIPGPVEKVCYATKLKRTFFVLKIS